MSNIRERLNKVLYEIPTPQSPIATPLSPLEQKKKEYKEYLDSRKEDVDIIKSKADFNSQIGNLVGQYGVKGPASGVGAILGNKLLKR
jgi:hypothetical protein